MKNKILVGVGLSACAIAWAAKDPVIMTINGVDVPKSEFEYLYHKNSQQQLAPQPLEEYAEMFKVYKLKVADAKACGLDTTESFRKEMQQYRRELAAPFMADSAYINKLVAEAAARALEDVEASHIMMVKTRDAAENRRLRLRLDSLRQELIAGADFTDLALRYSQDRSVVNNKGYMGFISSGRFPYEFETAAFTTPEGEISEVVESPAGYHIVKAGRHRTSRGKVEAAHIMKLLPKGASEAEKARAKHQIDSLYALVKADPSRFGEIAKSNSDDKGSARQNGKLPIFGSGEMVPEFEAAAFALKDGEISEPVKSMYGWHIIRKISQHSAQTEQELKPEILRRISNPQDGRYRLVKEHRTSNLAAKHQASLNSEAIGEIMSKAGENGIDSLFVASYIAGPLSSVTVAQIDGVSIPASEMFSNMKKLRQSDPGTASEVIKDVADNFFARKLVEAEDDWLYDNNAEYRNLLNEYRDGSLLYEVSVQKVWDKAAKDEAGLQRYFENHKGDYTWTEPRVKGVLVQTVNDSLANVIKTRMNELPADSLVQNIRKEFPGKVQIDKVLATKGTNAIVDNLVFGGPEVKPSNSNFTSYFMFEPRMLDNPEEAGDVRGQVTSDYQTELESLWIEELKKAYPVKVNKKELKKVK